MLKEKIMGLNHITIEDVDQLIRQPLFIEGKIHIYICIWHTLAKNEMENYKCDAQLGFESANYPNIEEFLWIGKDGRISLDISFIYIFRSQFDRNLLLVIII